MSAARKAWVVIAGIVVAEATPLLLMLRNSGLPRFARFIGLYPGSHHGTPLGWIVAMAVALVYVLRALQGLPFVREHFLNMNLMKLAVLLIFAPVTAIFEELFFRKALMDALAAHGFGAVVQVAASALAFGLAHAVWSLFGGQWRVGRNAAYATGLLGALLAVAYLLSARSLLPAIAAHYMINACIEPWLVLAATSKSWGRRMPSVS